MTTKEMLLWFERNLKKCADENGMISIKDLERETTAVLNELRIEELETTPIQKFIFVEDGSIDTDDLEQRLFTSNPEVKVIVYRQGSRAPEVVEVKKNGI
jgi:hypothetical protein